MLGPVRTAHRTPGADVPDGSYARPLRFVPNTLTSSAVDTLAPPGHGLVMTSPGQRLRPPRVGAVVVVNGPVPFGQRP